MIEVSHLTKRYGKKIAVNDVSFSIKKGEIVGFLGPNGAGKTTTMNILTGYLSSSGGYAKVGGFDVLENPSEAKKAVGYLPEFPPLYPDMTVEEYLDFVYDLKKCKLPKDEHLTQILEATKTDRVSSRLIRNLSKGYKQRVGLAQALIGNPEVLILDEPTVGLDPKEIKEIRNLIIRLGQAHTVILSSHILSEIQAVCQRVLIINDGYLVKDAPVDELLELSKRANRYAVRLAAPAEEVAPAIKSLVGVTEVEYMGVYEKGTVDVAVSTEEGVDIRKELFDLCAKKNWYILMITPLGVTLEDIFISLVSGNPEEEAKALEEKRLNMLSDGKDEKPKKKRYKKVIKKVVDKEGNLIRQTETLVEIDENGEEIG